MKSRCQVTRRGDKLLTKPGFIKYYCLGLLHHDDLRGIIANVMDIFQCQVRLSLTRQISQHQSVLKCQKMRFLQFRKVCNTT